MLSPVQKMSGPDAVIVGGTLLSYNLIRGLVSPLVSAGKVEIARMLYAGERFI